MSHQRTEILMKKLKAFIFGDEQIGKSELVKKLLSSDYINSDEHQYKPTIGTYYSQLIIIDDGEEDIQIELCDMGGQIKFKSLTNIYSEKSDFGIYCIDLTRKIDETQIKIIKADIERFKEYSPDAQMVLVGTKSDIARPDALTKAREILADIPFKKAIPASSRTVNGTKVLYTLLRSESRQKKLPSPKEYVDFFNISNLIIKARNRCVEDSTLYTALNHLNYNARQLPFHIIEGLGLEANTLIDHLENTYLVDKTKVIDSFIQKSNQWIRGEDYVLKSIIQAVAISALITVITAIIGFGIGFGLGLWSGPGAFFTGLAAGCAAALEVTGSASLLGLGTLSCTTYMFFKTTPLLESVKNVAQKATEDQPLLECSAAVKSAS